MKGFRAAFGDQADEPALVGAVSAGCRPSIDCHADIPSVPAVSLEQVLASRERRAAHQAAALARFGKPLISATVVMPGPVKDGDLPRRVLMEALAQIDNALSDRGWRVLLREVLWQRTGPEALFSVDAQAQELKLAMIKLEDGHPLGRLWDLDVIASGPHILTRKELERAPRRCLVCERAAFECSRSRRHPLPQLLKTMQTIVSGYDG